jgi:uncharacterized damage-inducible protein DinB
MSAQRNIRMLTRYNKWANEKVFKALYTLPEEIVCKKNNAAFGGILFTLAHISIVDQIWQAHLLGVQHGFTTRTTDCPDSLDKQKMKFDELDNWYIQYADEMSESLLNETIKFSFVDGGFGEMRRGDILLHICNHKAFHRGHIGDMFYQSGNRLPSIDLPVYLRDAFNETELA